MKKNIVSWCIILTVVILLSLVIVYAEKFSLPSNKVADGVVAIISAFVGILITIAVTAILLSTQSEMDSLTDRNVKQFEKKQETYYVFLEKLGETVRLLTERCLRGNDANYGNITSLEEVIFQFGYLRIHMDDVTFLKVISNTSEMIGVLHRLNLDILYKQKIVGEETSLPSSISCQLFGLISKISNHLFVIASILNENLYGKKLSLSNQVDIYEEVKKMLINCGLKEKQIQ